tara:strand:- start:11839 stop:11946 length:108 start_codon:yes stop_codon:yes gene_type:complete
MRDFLIDHWALSYAGVCLLFGSAYVFFNWRDKSSK